MPRPTAQQVHIDRALTALSIAYFQESPPLSDQMFPRVPVEFQSDAYFIWSKADLWRDDAQLRAPGADFAQMALSVTTDTYRAAQYALEYAIPDEIVKNEDAAVRLEETGTRALQSRLSLRKDRAFVADFVKTGVWATDKVGTTDFVKWNDTTSDPAGDMQAAMETILNASGDVEGLRFKLLMGSIVRSRLVNHPDAIDRIKHVQKADIATIDGAMAAWLGVDEIVVGRRRYTTSGEGVTATYGAVVGDDALLVAVPASAGLETPSAGYTFEWNEEGKGPMYVERYRFEPKKSDILRGITYFDQKLVASDLGYFFDDCVD